VRVVSVESAKAGEMKTGERFRVRASLQLGSLSPDDVCVELCSGPLDRRGELSGFAASEMQCAGAEGAGLFRFEGSAQPCRASGLYGYTIRILPCRVDMVCPFLPGLITWAEPSSARPTTASQ
jgi:glycogen phosphorylase